MPLSATHLSGFGANNNRGFPWSSYTSGGVVYDFTNASTVTTSGSEVTDVTNAGGGGSFAATRNAGAGPTYVTGQYATFDGTNDLLQIVGGDVLWHQTNWATIVRRRDDNTTENDRWLFGDTVPGTGGGSLHTGRRNTTQEAIGYWGNDLNVANTPTSNWEVWTYQQRSGGRRMRKNGVQIGTDTNTTLLNSSGRTMVFGGCRGTLYYAGDISHFFTVPRDLSDTERGEIEAYLLSL